MVSRDRNLQINFKKVHIIDFQPHPPQTKVAPFNMSWYLLLQQPSQIADKLSAVDTYGKYPFFTVIRTPNNPTREVQFPGIRDDDMKMILSRR